MNKLKKIRFEVISQNILDNIRIREIEFGNLKFYHNNDRTNNINITSNLNFDLNNDGIITNYTTEYNTIVNGDFNNYLIIDKNTTIFQKFIEFDFDLNYDMPNLLNSLSYTKLYWNTPSDIYTDERIYPSQYARLNYFDKIDGNSSDIYIIENAGYANGTYEIAYSTRYNSTNHSPHYVFSSKNMTYHNDATWQNNQYDNGEYIGNHFFNNLGYYGDWITIKMPVNIIPTKIRFVSILLNSSHTNRLPKKYRLYGYFNYAWELIIDDYIDDDYEYETYNSIPNIAYTKNIENAKNYNKYALVVNKIGNTNVLAMSNFEIFGREIINDKLINNDISSDPVTFLELKTKIFDNDDNIIELNNTVLNSEELIHGIKNGIMTSYNMTKYVLFKEERLYPPYYKSEILLFENFFIENKIYGNGKYKIEYSSTYSDNNKPLNIFRNNYYNGMWQSNSYTWNNKQKNTLLARSLFNGTSYLKDESYKGEWITINLPYKILLTKIILALFDSNELDQKSYDNAIYHFPHDFRIYGKNNNDEEWELIIHKNIDKSNLNNKYDNENNLNVAFEYKLSDNDRLTKFKTFENYGLVVSEIGGNEYLNFSKWDIYGRELTSILDNKPDNIPSKKNIKFSQLSKVFDDEFDNKNINITNYYKDNLVYDFSSQTSLNEWIEYVEEIGGTTNISHYYTASQLSGSHGNEHGVFKGGTEMGYFDLPLPSQFNKIKITFRNVYNKADGVVKIKIGGEVISEQIGMSATETTQWITYNEGGHFRIEEGHSIWSANLKLEFTNNENLYKYDHNISIPNDGIISLSNFKNTSSFIDNIPFADNIYARYETKYESLYILDNIVKQWYDSSGNNRHIIVYRGNPIVKYFERGTKGTIGKNYFNVIKGDYDSGYKLPFRLNFDYTFCYVARYVGDKNNTTYNRRIFDSSSGIGQNTSWGFHNNYSGISHNYKSGWHTTTHKQHSETDYWMIGIETQNTARYNGQDCTNYYEYKGINYPQKYSDYNVQLTINYGYYTGETYTTETSNWEIAEMIFYNKELNLDEKINIEQYLAKKCGHISFSNVVDNLEDYKTIIKSQNYINDLSDMWYYVYDGYKYGYSDLTDKFYGPVNFRFNLYKYINDDDIIKYYWILNLNNNNETNSSSNYTNRNSNLQSYNIKIPYANSYLSIVSGGAGAGGGSPYIGGIYTSYPGGHVYTRYQNYRYVYSKWPSSAYYNIGMSWNNTYGITIYPSGGGSGGGQAYIHDYLMTEELNLTVDIGSSGKGFNDPSPGGDTTTKWVDSSGVEYILKGNGGLEGHAYSNYKGITNGGQYEISPLHLSNIGGGNGGNSVVDSYNLQTGGPISTILKTVYLNSNISFWDILDEFFTYWSDRRIIFDWEQGRYYGAGGPGGQNYYNGATDKFARGGGPGYIFMILDFNNTSTSVPLP